MIISISGKMGSGKDAAGKIIQYLENPRVDNQSIAKAVKDPHRNYKATNWVIKNNGTLEELVEVLRNILLTEKII